MRRWMECKEKLPPNDTNLQIKVMFADGYTAISDGRTVNLNFNYEPTKQIVRWEVPNNEQE